MRTLITGGAGFIGSHLARRLAGEGDSVRVLDDLSTGLRANLAELEGDAEFEFVEGSVLDARLVDELADDADRIFHLAAVVGVRLVLEQPVETLRTNVRGTENVLAAAARRGLFTFVASSSEVYGKSTRLPFHEEADLVLGAPSSGRWVYAASKATNERSALARWQAERLPVVVARFFNTVGPGQRGRYGMVLPRFVARAVAGERLEVHGTGKQTRAFCHVEDTVEACLRLAAETRARGHVVNVGGDREVSILELAHVVKRLAQSDSEIAHVPHEEVYGSAFEDVRRRVPDLSRLEALTGYRPTTPLEGIVEDMLARHAFPAKA